MAGPPICAVCHHRCPRRFVVRYVPISGSWEACWTTFEVSPKFALVLQIFTHSVARCTLLSGSICTVTLAGLYFCLWRIMSFMKPLAVAGNASTAKLVFHGNTDKAYAQAEWDKLDLMYYIASRSGWTIFRDTIFCFKNRLGDKQSHEAEVASKVVLMTKVNITPIKGVTQVHGSHWLSFCPSSLPMTL